MVLDISNEKHIFYTNLRGLTIFSSDLFFCCSDEKRKDNNGRILARIHRKISISLCFEQQEIQNKGDISLKKLCEIYDISKEYDMSDNSVLVIVSELKENIIFTALPELKCYSDRIMKTEEWNEFLEINASYRRNEN